MLPVKFWSIAGGVILIDQMTKWLASDIFLVTSNGGISFGLMKDIDQTILVGLVVMTILILFSARQLINDHPVWLGLLVGGGASNLIDRLITGGVRDFLPVPGLNLTNNVADWAITVGVVGLLITILRQLQAHRAGQTNDDKTH